MALNLAHMCRFIWEWIYGKQIAPRDTRGHMAGLRGSKIQNLGKLSNDWTDWHQIWYTCSSLNTPGAFQCGLGGHKFKSLGKLSNGWTDCHQIWHTCADSSGNGHSPNKLPLETQGGTWEDLGGQQFKISGSCQTLYRLAPNLAHVCGFVWE